MRAVDTNVLVRLLTRDHPKQTSAAERYVAGGAWVSHLVLVETTWVLDSVYELMPSQIALAIEMLLSHKDLAIQDSEVVVSALETFRSHPNLGFSDCLVLETARKAGHLPLGTFDKGFGRLVGAERI